MIAEHAMDGHIVLVCTRSLVYHVGRNLGTSRVSRPPTRRTDDRSGRTRAPVESAGRPASPFRFNARASCSRRPPRLIYFPGFLLPPPLAAECRDRCTRPLAHLQSAIFDFGSSSNVERRSAGIENWARDSWF